MKNKRLHINRILTLVMLWVFSLAITPWSALHHHAEVSTSDAEKHCTHKVHVKNQQDNCLVCAAHFEKNYTKANDLYTVYLEGKPIAETVYSYFHSYTALISTSLRGPPALPAIS